MFLKHKDLYERKWHLTGSKFYPLLSSDGVGMRNSTYTHSPEHTSVNSLAES